MEKEHRFKFQVFENYDGLDETEKMLFDAASAVRENAYAEYSNFLVGCALLLEDGTVVTGSNQENAAYPSGLCAERTAIFWTSANYPNAKIKKIFVVGGPKFKENNQPIPPCGACRQSILEYEGKQSEAIEIYFASPNGEIIKTHSVRDLLPFSFDVSYL